MAAPAVLMTARVRDGWPGPHVDSMLWFFERETQALGLGTGLRAMRFWDASAIMRYVVG